MKILRFIIFLFGFLSCGNLSNKSQETIGVDKLNADSRINAKKNNDNEELNQIILNSNLAEKFDSIKNKYIEYDKSLFGYDTLMKFQKNDRDTLIRIKEIKFLESFDPNAAYYLYKNDTIIGGNGYCASDYYLLIDRKLIKTINQYADCVESASSSTIVLIFESEMKKWYYLKDIKDVWDEVEFKKGFEGSETEIIAYFDSNKVQLAIKKNLINCRSDMNLKDTIKYELIEYEDFLHLIPEIMEFKN